MNQSGSHAHSSASEEGAYNGTDLQYPGTEGRERGTRRRKLAGYLKAANDLRQSYQQSYGSSWGRSEADVEDQGIPGAFPDVSIVRSGDEEMVLFPSYARRHVKKIETHPDPSSTHPTAAGDAAASSSQGREYWDKEWEKHEDLKAIVDVDVRGWIYSPHRGPMTRKNRLLVGLARHLSGVPAPSGNLSTEGQNCSSPSINAHHPSHHERMEARAAEVEEEIVHKEAESILKKGQGEADFAGRGEYSEEPAYDSDRMSIYSADSRNGGNHRISRRDAVATNLRHSVSNSSLGDEESLPKSLTKRASWNQPSDMTPEELASANAHLMTRLKPFLTNPLSNTPITVFFYNNNTSQSRSIYTDDAGHFSMRAPLDFIPTHVRVLASDRLSATEEVLITEPSGVSLISDIDDTIKHSAVGSGAKEIFRNTFIRELSDLTVEGVKEWYTQLADMGVKIHYVSNSPWQLYPVLVTYFSMAGLPPGSFHLKQYSGMLQGIFEPVAERKKSTLERIMRDFPERRFILVGDSGEADLEVYTDIVLANPKRVIGVFIRDVTSPPQKAFFDSTMGPLSASRKQDGNRLAQERSSSSSSTPSSPELRPALPPRRPNQPTSNRSKSESTVDYLIDLSDGTSSTYAKENLNQTASVPLSQLATSQENRNKPPSPLRPSKPSALRSNTVTRQTPLPSPAVPNTQIASSPSVRKPPIPPPKPLQYSISQEYVVGGNQNPQKHPLAQTQNISESEQQQKAKPHNEQSYAISVRQKVASAYNSLPSASSYWNGPSTSSPASDSNSATDRRGSSVSSAPQPNASQIAPPPPPPSRRPLTSYPAAAAQYASNQISSRWNGSSIAAAGTTAGANSNGTRYEDSSLNPNNSTAPVNKKEELWKRRWARAKEILDSKRVELRSWRVGEDVMSDAIRLVELANKELDKKDRGWRG
ncbi:MAG: hypothetical protein M1829_005347 [Trizodia sp. TS-e1964]|nr:MAG: hypothetical protein M1829_005347 [Trizodia sp. TS-e1964]